MKLPSLKPQTESLHLTEDFFLYSILFFSFFFFVSNGPQEDASCCDLKKVNQ